MGAGQAHPEPEPDDECPFRCKRHLGKQCMGGGAWLAGRRLMAIDGFGLPFSGLARMSAQIDCSVPGRIAVRRCWHRPDSCPPNQEDR